MSKTLKPSTTFAQQIVLLRERGMRVDESLATQWLENVSYYRLSAYWFPARLPVSNGEKSDSFQAGISFTDVVALYEADRKLRTLIHDGIERIEVASSYAHENRDADVFVRFSLLHEFFLFPPKL